MSLGPGYGITPVSDDDAVAQQPAARSILGDCPLKAEIYDLEQ